MADRMLQTLLTLTLVTNFIPVGLGVELGPERIAFSFKYLGFVSSHELRRRVTEGFGNQF